MAEEKKDDKNKPACPLCKVSEETIKRLKEAAPSRGEPRSNEFEREADKINKQ